jgi:hypothetical protein
VREKQAFQWFRVCCPDLIHAQRSVGDAQRQQRDGWWRGATAFCCNKDSMMFVRRVESAFLIGVKLARRAGSERGWENVERRTTSRLLSSGGSSKRMSATRAGDHGQITTKARRRKEGRDSENRAKGAEAQGRRRRGVLDRTEREGSPRAATGG